MSVNSRLKGARGELEFAQLLRDHGFSAHRGQQYAGGTDSPDVVTDLPGVHFEVKRTNRLKLRQAMDQAERDADAGLIPVVAHRADRESWLVTLSADDFIGLHKRLSPDD